MVRTQRNSTEVCFTYWLQNERRPNSYNLKGIQGRLAAILYWWQRYLIIICKTTPREALLMQCTGSRFFNNGWCGTHTSGDHPQGCAQGGASGASPPQKLCPDLYLAHNMVILNKVIKLIVPLLLLIWLCWKMYVH